MSETKNVFIVGLDQFNLEKLQRLSSAKNCAFHAALDVSEMRGVSEFQLSELIDRASERIEKFQGRVDAVATYYDFPGSTIVPILAERFGLPGPTLQSVLTCEHKYWSRLEQQKVIPDHIPSFQVFDPFDDDAFNKIDLVPPYWIKPVKSFRSFLAFQINGPGQFQDAMQQVREHIDYMGEPFRWLMKKYGMPAEYADMPETMIAESPLSGSMCTVEAYSFNGRVTGYGIVDSVREPDRSSFARYEYPSFLPLEVQHRVIDVSRQAISQIGLDNTGFNIEFFYDQTIDQVYLLEINPRVSQAHTDVFEKVHGQSHLRVMLDLALGKKPSPFERKGKYNIGCNFMLRVYYPGRVVRVPTQQEVDQVLSEKLATNVKIHVKEGQHLGTMKGQDSYSFELANLFIGGRDQLEIVEKYHRALDILGFQIQRDPEPIGVRPRRVKFRWNGQDLPDQLQELPPGDYVIEAVM